MVPKITKCGDLLYPKCLLLQTRVGTSSCHLRRPTTPGALILNHLETAKSTEKSWSVTTYSKFSAICCFGASMLHPNGQKMPKICLRNLWRLPYAKVSERMQIIMRRFFFLHYLLFLEYGLLSFQAGATKLERFVHKNQITVFP